MPQTWDGERPYICRDDCQHPLCRQTRGDWAKWEAFMAGYQSVPTVIKHGNHTHINSIPADCKES